jgi:hypothetical protein
MFSCHRLRLVIATALLPAMVPAAAEAGAFLQEEGRAQLIVTTLAAGASTVFDARGRVVPVAPWAKFELSGSAEYGVTDWATLLVGTAYDQFFDDSTPIAGVRGLGISSLGGRFALWQVSGWQINGETSLRLPGPGVRVWAGSPDAATSVDARVTAGRSFELLGRDAFVGLELGGRWHAGGFAPEGLFEATLGVRVLAPLTVLVQSFTNAAPAGGLLPARFSSKVQGSLVWEMRPGVSIQAGLYGTLVAVNASREHGLISGMWYKF